MIKHLFPALLLGAAVVLGPIAANAPAFALSEELQAYIGDEPVLFDTPEAAVAAFKDTMAKGDLAAVARLLGLDPDKLAKAEGIAAKMDELRTTAAELVTVDEEGDQQILNLGRQLWPFPFPLVKGEDGKWAFDTVAGIEEVIIRRVGENELQAIETMRLYVQAQQDYAAEDRDADGVLEYAQKLLSTEGQTDGLYWPIAQGDGESPFGPNLDPSAIEKAKAGDGYFGYRYRILRRQGERVAGGAYDYVINGNMIGGFALIAWPVRYAESGVHTFVVNHAGIVYEKDFGFDTANIVEKIKSFNPGDSWQVMED